MTSNLINRRVLLASRPKGVPQAEHFAIEEVPVAELEAGELLVESEFWSVDPAMRGWSNDLPNYLPPVEIGAVMRSFASGKVVASRNPDYAEGELVVGALGWQRYAISDGSNIDRKLRRQRAFLLPGARVLGLNGVTAYFGLLDICQPPAG